MQFYLALILAYLFLIFPALNFAAISVDNQTFKYLSFYFLNSSLCISGHEKIAFPNSASFNLGKLSLIFYCRTFDLCYGYTYTSDSLADAKICYGQFLGVYIIDVKRMSFTDVTLRNPLYSVSGIGTSAITIHS